MISSKASVDVTLLSPDGLIATLHLLHPLDEGCSSDRLILEAEIEFRSCGFEEPQM